MVAVTSDFLVHFPGLGLNDIPVNRVAFELFGWPVYWYGLLIAFALMLCMVLAIRQAPRFGLEADVITDAFIAIIPLMIIFARLFYVVFQWDYYAGNWKRIFNTRDGGLAFYGGVIGGVLALLLIRRFKQVKLASLLDFLAVYIPLGQAIGRWGNFFNQEAFGNNTSLPWGMISNQTQRYLAQVTTISGLDPNKPVHPTFFYEFVANLLIFVWLLRVRKKSTLPFETTLWYFLSYGFVRFFVESVRTDPLMIPGTGLRVSMVLSALMVIGSVVLLLVLKKRRERQLLAGELAAPDPLAVSPPQDDADEDFILLDDKGQETAPEPNGDPDQQD